jgi:hypothetical protein
VIYPTEGPRRKTGLTHATLLDAKRLPRPHSSSVLPMSSRLRRRAGFEEQGPESPTGACGAYDGAMDRMPCPFGETARLLARRTFAVFFPSV